MKIWLLILTSCYAIFSFAAGVGGGQGIVRYDASDYVDDGLVANFDGIQNDGADNPHSSTTTIWKNLCGNIDASLILGANATDEEKGEWLENGYRFVGHSYMYLDSALNLGKNFTIQVVFDVSLTDQIVQYPNIIAIKEFDSGAFLSQKTDGTYSSTLTWKTEKALSETKNRNTTTFNSKYLTLAADENYSYQFGSTALSTSSNERRARTLNNDINYRWGWGSSPNGPDIRMTVGTYYSVRFYNRCLSNEELAWNRMVDEVRFRGAAIPVTNVIVKVSNQFKEDEVYTVNGEYVFNAPAPIIMDNGDTYTCYGYQLKTWNVSAKKWDAGDATEATTYTYPGEGKVEITWLMGLSRGLRQAKDYGVKDYVQDNLFSHYDGIKNAGVDAEHDYAATEWANLAKSENPMIFGHRSVYTSEWLDNGYRFDGDSYTEMKTSIGAIGTNMTIEVAVDVDKSKLTTQYPNIFSIYGECGMFSRGGDVANAYRDLEFKTPWDTDKPYPTIRNWHGKYATAVKSSDNTISFFEGTEYENTKVCQQEYSVNSREWKIGTAAISSEGPESEFNIRRYMHGVFHSLRVYSRALLPSELKWNRKVDDARFRGAVITNVIVASSHPKMVNMTTEKDGIYEVIGNWTFTAPTEAVGSDGETRRLLGYSLKTFANGTWSKPVNYVGNSYTHDMTVESRPVMLKWRWESGSIIILR